jgi:hypothetical protein
MTTPLAQHCYSLLDKVPLFCTRAVVIPYSLFDVVTFVPFVSNWYSPSSFFTGVGRTIQIEILHAKLGR